MNYLQTLDYIFSSMPMFQRIGGLAYKPDIGNTLKICEITNQPQRNFPAIHIAGTNGKGSVSHMLASILQESGFVTGLFTSPHLKDFRERIKINGQMIPEEAVVSFVEQYRTDFEIIQPSFFEMTFGMAMHWFSMNRIDIAIIETGMGGRLDSTNVITPLLSVITNIGYDHTQFLGDTLEAIAREKAGIIKPGIPVIIGESNQATATIFHSFATENKSPLIFADQTIQISRCEPSSEPGTMRLKAQEGQHEWLIDCPLTGQYQLKNICTVLAATSEITKRFSQFRSLKIEDGIRNTLSNTGLKGRWQTLRTRPLTICDIGHNADGIREVVEQFGSMSYHHLHFVIGVVNDKDIRAMLALLPAGATYYFCKADIPRGLDATLLRDAAQAFNLAGSVYGSVKEALNAAWDVAGNEDLVFIGGSAFTVAEVI